MVPSRGLLEYGEFSLRRSPHGRALGIVGPWPAIGFVESARHQVHRHKLVARVSLTGGSDTLSNSGLDTSKLIGIYDAIREGADSFLRAEYTICAYFIASFGVVVLLMTSYVEKKFQIDQGGLTAEQRGPPFQILLVRSLAPPSSPQRSTGSAACR